MTVLEERGLFWWDTGKLGENVIAPDPYVAGLLKIDDAGRTTLELDGYLPTEYGPMGPIIQKPLPREKRIHGVLKESNREVLLCNIARNGGRFGSSSISYDKFSAEFCLVAVGAALPDRRLTFNRIDISLDGLQYWLRLHAMKITHEENVTSVRYERPAEANYPLSDGSITIEFSLDEESCGKIFGSEVSLKEKADASLRFEASQDLDSIQKQHQLFQDFLLLLTNTPIVLSWPLVGINEGQLSRRSFLFFSRR